MNHVIPNLTGYLPRNRRDMHVSAGRKDRAAARAGLRLGEGGRPSLNARLGPGGAQFMSTHLRPGGTLGVGWGDTMSRVIAATCFGAVGPVRMVSLTGGVDAYPPAFLTSKGEGPLDARHRAVRPGAVAVQTPKPADARDHESGFAIAESYPRVTE